MADLVPFLWLLVLALIAALAGLVAQQNRLRQEKSRHAEQLAAEKVRLGNYANVLENCDDVAWLYDIDRRRMTYVSPSIQRQRGWEPAEMINKSLSELIPSLGPEQIQEVLEDLEKSPAQDMQPARARRLELSVPLKQGGTIPIETVYKLINNAEGKPRLVMGISRDIRERRQREQQLRDAEERVRLALKCSGDGVWDVNLQTREMRYVEGWEAVLGYGRLDVEPSLDGFLRLIHSDDVDRVKAEIARHCNDETPTFQCEFRIRVRDGGWRWVLSRGKIWTRTGDGLPLLMIGTHTDITARKVAEAAMSRANDKLHTQIDEIRLLQTRLAEQAIRDPLTSLYNRRYLDVTLEREVARARREGNPLSIVMLDVDNFKKLNDAYGHQAGDEVLKALAELLREATRAEDVACRYGGEEFLVLLPNMPLEKARERAEHWRKRLEQHTFVFGNFPLSVTASFGVSGYPNHGKAPEELTRSADAALYTAKNNGRNRVEMYEDAPIMFVTGKT